MALARALAAGVNVRATYSSPTASPSMTFVFRSHVCHRGKRSFWPVKILRNAKSSSPKRFGRRVADVLSRRQRSSVFQSSTGMEVRKPSIALKKSGCDTLMALRPDGAPIVVRNVSHFIRGAMESNCATVIT